MTAQSAEHFLEDYDGHSLPWTRPTGAPAAFQTDRILFGNGDNALEVAIASATHPGQPKAESLRALFKKRQANRPTPVLLVVTYVGPDNRSYAAVVGTVGDPAPATALSEDRVARICVAALTEPDRHAAARTAERLLTGLKDQLSPGLVNSGLFASHELRVGVPARPDWAAAGKAALPFLGLHGLPLIHALGYETTPRGSTAMMLSHDGHSRAIAVLLNETEVFDRPSARFGAISPIAHGLTVAAREELPWLVVLRNTQIRLYPAKPDVGVGRKGQGETFTELDLALLSDAESAYLELLFAPSALSPGGTVQQILDASQNFAVGLGQRLRERIYVDVIPGLALAVASRMNPQADADLAEAYHRTLLILFRLLFLAYAEDRGLLPYGRNPRYDRHAVKTLARDFAAEPKMVFDQHATSLWDDMLNVWAAVDEGNAGWDVPAYDGGLFSRDAVSSPSGAAIAKLRLTDAEFAPVLRALLVDIGEDGTQGPVDFRSLSVREFGTIYEGLLESDLSISHIDLTVDRKGSYLPAGPDDSVVVRAEQVYIHNKSGQRKATGSYFTKQFAVEQLLDSALEPAITDHLSRIKALLIQGDEASAADAFFDFRVADLAMGSAHFLVAAVDRIEAKFTAFLTEHPIPAVSDELTRLLAAAHGALGDHATNVEIETGTLLRRQIARRCIYGLDLNLMAVELARLAIWIHTFVPGLPMSTLDHNLVVGNSLTGVGTLHEVLDVFEPQRSAGQSSLFADRIEEELFRARTRLSRVARTAEATKQEVKEAEKAYATALADADEAKAVLNAAIAVQDGLAILPSDPDIAIDIGRSAPVRLHLTRLKAVHFPYLFPEVFMRDNPGFDVILGNPPWEELVYEEIKFWALQFPGLKGMPASKQQEAMIEYRKTRPDLLSVLTQEMVDADLLRAALMAGPYPGMGSGHADLYKAFCWRFWRVLRDRGRAGVVLPRGALSAAGSAAWREAVLTGGSFTSVITLVNTNQWVFDEVHGQYSLGLVTITKDTDGPHTVALRGPYHSMAEFEAARSEAPAEFAADQFKTWASGAAFPMLPDTRAGDVFLALRRHPRLDDESSGAWLFKPLQGDFNATTHRSYFNAPPDQPGMLPVYSGASFNLWTSDTGGRYGYADPSVVLPILQTRRFRQARTSSSPYYGLPSDIIADPGTLAPQKPRIAFRDVARATDTRTVIAALVPPHIILTNKAPYLVQRRGDMTDEAYLLGMLCSIPLDWYARRYVEISLNFHILNAFPIPRPASDDLRRLRVVEIAGRLAAVDHRYEHWARAVGVPVGSVTSSASKDDLIAELDAVVALLYGLTRPDVEHIFATFHRGWNYGPRLAAVLAHYEQWATATRGGEG